MQKFQLPFRLHLFFLRRKFLLCLSAIAIFIGTNAQTPVPPQTLVIPEGNPPAQPPTYVTIRNIYIEGNRRTKPDIILREMDFGKNDTISLATLDSRLVQNEFNILNTGLFTSTKIVFSEWTGKTNEIGLTIQVKEGWYIFPFPILELADRNFNIWWETYDHSLRRLNYGVRFYHTNLTGHKDLLKAVVQQGFTKKYELVYTLPFINRKKTLGLNLNYLQTREKEIGYTTLDNELIFANNSNQTLLRRFRLGVGVQLRRRLDITHSWGLAYHKNLIDETVRSELNPDFFLDGLEQQYLSANYRLVVDKRDIKPYPMHGFYIESGLNWQGIGPSNGLNAMNLSATWQQFFSLHEKWSAGYVFRGKLGLLRDQQPYFGSQALGYEPDFIRGYEYYVVDGLDFAYNKAFLRYRFFDRKLNLGPYMRLESFKEMPLKLYLVAHNELGYVNNPFYHEGNSFANELLWGTTLGVDVVLYYDKVFNFEVSRNRLGEYGFYLHWTFSF